MDLSHGYVITNCTTFEGEVLLLDKIITQRRELTKSRKFSLVICRQLPGENFRRMTNGEGSKHAVTMGLRDRHDCVGQNNSRLN